MNNTIYLYKKKMSIIKKSGKGVKDLRVKEVGLS